LAGGTVLLSLSLGDNAGSLVAYPEGYPASCLTHYIYQSQLPVTLSILKHHYHGSYDTFPLLSGE